MAARQQKFEGMFSSTVIALLWLLAFSMFCMAQSQSIVETLPGFPGKLPFKLETGYVGVGKQMMCNSFTTSLNLRGIQGRTRCCFGLLEALVVLASRDWFMKLVHCHLITKISMGMNQHSN